MFKLTHDSPPTVERRRHDGDCTFYASVDNGLPTDGICTCGYGLFLFRRNGDDSELTSKELDSTLRHLDKLKVRVR